MNGKLLKLIIFWLVKIFDKLSLNRTTKPWNDLFQAQRNHVSLKKKSPTLKTLFKSLKVLYQQYLASLWKPKGIFAQSTTSHQKIKIKITTLITYRAKLLNADWLRQRAFFLNFPSMEGKITRFWLAERQNVLAPDWLSAPFLHLVGFLKSFAQNFPKRDRFKFWF